MYFIIASYLKIPNNLQNPDFQILIPFSISTFLIAFDPRS